MLLQDLTVQKVGKANAFRTHFGLEVNVGRFLIIPMGEVVD